MRRSVLFVFCVAFSLLSVAAVMSRPPDRSESGPSVAAQEPAPRQAATAADTFVLADFDFDDGVGGPDTQGWTSADRTEQDLYFHVDDFATTGGPYAPLSGARSLWCGVETAPGCAACPGYGDGWVQYFESVAFPSSGDVTVDFLIEYDSEPGYDYTYVQYLSQSAIWQTLDTYNGVGAELASLVVPADSIDGSVKLRFYFVSDGAYSDVDGLYPSNGAVIIDDLTVSDTTGVIDFQDFEAEAVGVLATADGDWAAGTYTPFGDYAGLFDGSAVLQEDSLIVNNTYLWGFFDGSTDTYACGGHPEQTAVPFADDPESAVITDFLDNEIRSPFIDLSQDENGAPIEGQLGGLVLEFDVYRDLPLDNLVFYSFSVRYLVDGDVTPWDDSHFLFHSTAAADWFRHVADLTDTHVQGATHIQVAIRCIDGKPLLNGSGDCHSHAPLIDNVRVLHTVSDPIMVTNANDSGAGSLRQAMLDAEIAPDRNEIRFDIPGAGPHVITVQSNLPLPQSPVVLDATTQPGYSGTPLVVVDGGGVTAGLRGPHLYNNSVLRGFEIRNFEWEGLIITGDYNHVEGNHIHDNGYSGLVVASGARHNVIGGPTPDLGNRINGNDGAGIHIEASTSKFNSVLCNTMLNNQGLGIDLRLYSHLDGVTANDDQDPDLGPNNFQNFPVLRWADVGSSTIGASLNSIPNSTFRVQFFSNSVVDATTYGEAETYLGSTEVSTGPDGNVDFVATVDTPFGVTDYLSATATAADGSTSELAQCLSVSAVTGVDDRAVVRPALHAAVPNPFNPSTVIRYDVPDPGAHVRIVVYDVAGRRVATLVDGHRSAGSQRVTWNGSNDHGAEVATGVYFYKMNLPGFNMTRKMTLLK